MSSNKVVKTVKHYFSSFGIWKIYYTTLPETNSQSPWKIDGWKTFPASFSIFKGFCCYIHHAMKWKFQRPFPGEKYLLGGWTTHLKILVPSLKLT